MDEADVERILAYPETMVGSDGLPHDAFPHPRLWGAFPRVLGHYAREREPVLAGDGGAQDDRAAGSALRPAGRGLVQPGFAADLVVFDPERVTTPPPLRSRCSRPSAFIAST